MSATATQTTELPSRKAGGGAGLLAVLAAPGALPCSDRGSATLLPAWAQCLAHRPGLIPFEDWINAVVRVLEKECDPRAVHLQGPVPGDLRA